MNNLSDIPDFPISYCAMELFTNKSQSASQERHEIRESCKDQSLSKVH